MSHWQLKTPVAFFIFNRPNTTEQVFTEIAKVKPLKLLVVADGPRADHPSDVERCKAARAVIDKVDWNCEVLKNYSDVNLGCRERVSSGLNWVFNTVEAAIVLEDDCVPHPTFFRFCEELLEKYWNNEEIALISGTNVCLGRKKTPYSYYFSRYPQIWGWASWRRFWKEYDVNIKRWPTLKDSGWLETVLNSRGPVYQYWRNVFDIMHQGKMYTWDYQVTFTIWVDRSLAIIPNVNLVSNIGFESKPGYPLRRWHKFANLKREAMTFPLSHPPSIERDVEADKFTEKYTFTFYRSLPVKAFYYLSYRIRRLFLE